MKLARSLLAGWFVVSAITGCDAVADKDAPMATKERSQAVTQKVEPAKATIPVVTTAPMRPAKPRSLCGAKLERPFPKRHLSRAAAKEVPPLPESLLVGSGRWTWVNFWAAWCAPCKEEIPRLLAFQKKLGASGLRLSFVSLDDDARQLADFLEGQPATGVRASYWLREGGERDDWLKAAGKDPDDALPFHFLVDPAGKIRCIVDGAVEDGDFDEIAGIVARR